MLCSEENDVKAIKLYKEVKEFVDCGGFNLTKMVSNSNSLMKIFDINNSCKNLYPDANKNTKTKVLGLTWNTFTETCFQFCMAYMIPWD